jgi:hypothetical protein
MEHATFGPLQVPNYITDQEIPKVIAIGRKTELTSIKCEQGVRHQAKKMGNEIQFNCEDTKKDNIVINKSSDGLKD